MLKYVGEDDEAGDALTQLLKYWRDHLPNSELCNRWWHVGGSGGEVKDTMPGGNAFTVYESWSICFMANLGGRIWANFEGRVIWSKFFVHIVRWHSVCSNILSVHHTPEPCQNGLVYWNTFCLRWMILSTQSTCMYRYFNGWHRWGGMLHRDRKKGATWFFAVTLPNPNRSSKFFYHHTQQ